MRVWKLALEEEAMVNVPNPSFTRLVTLFNVILKGIAWYVDRHNETEWDGME